MQAHFVSTGAAPGGQEFDSGLLETGERFQFVPNSEGTWDFVDQVSGAIGSLIVEGICYWCTGSSATYDRVSSSFIPGTSRYVLYGDGSFKLQYVTPSGSFEYPGTYQLADPIVTLRFDGRSAAGPWLADGVLSGDSLIVRYNVVMQLSDFEDGVYLRR